jgi:hypothetical protein
MILSCILIWYLVGVLSIVYIVLVDAKIGDVDFEKILPIFLYIIIVSVGGVVMLIFACHVAYCEYKRARDLKVMIDCINLETRRS